MSRRKERQSSGSPPNPYENLTIHQAHRQDRRWRFIPSLLILAFLVAAGAAWIGLFGFLMLNAAFGTASNVVDHYMCETEGVLGDFPSLTQSSEVYTADGVLLGELAERNAAPTPLSEIPDTVIDAVLAAEDADFYLHSGYDVEGIGRAALASATGGNRQGGSTITQQVVKQNFYTDAPTIERKACEVLLAVQLEKVYTKDEILEYYLNSVYYGANSYGVAAAAREYFDKDLDELTIAEAAVLPVPIRNPSYYHPRRYPSRVLRARDKVIIQMVDKGFITQAEGDAALGEPLRVVPHVGQGVVSPQVLIAARRELLNNPEYGLGDTEEQRRWALFGCPASQAECEGGGGLVVTVTVNQYLQTLAESTIRDWLGDRTDKPTGAIAMIDNNTGAIRVMAGGLRYGGDIQGGEREYDLATLGTRQPGSSFKPFTLITALTQGDLNGNPLTLGTYYDSASPVEIDCGYPCDDDSNIWTVSNAGGHGYGFRTLEKATYTSTNTVFAQLIMDVGAENVVETAHAAGISANLEPYPSLTLGTQSVSPLDMASAYSTIANYGERVPSYLIERIETREGDVIYQHETVPQRVWDPLVGEAVVHTMERVLQDGTARHVNFGREAAGKTGTAQDYKDVWFVGFVPQYTTSMWVGYADGQRPMVDFSVWDPIAGEEVHHARAYGGTVAGPIWADFMTKALAGVPVEPFRDSGDDALASLYLTPTVELPKMVGLPIDEVAETLHALRVGVEAEAVPAPEDEGIILTATPEDSVEQGQSVVITYSSGELPTVTVADLYLQPLDAAAELVAKWREEDAMELTWRVETADTLVEAEDGLIVATSPSAGEPLTYGEEFVVMIGHWTPPPTTTTTLPPTTTTTTAPASTTTTTTMPVTTTTEP